MVKVNGRNHANPSFQILPEFFSGKSFMQRAPYFSKFKTKFRRALDKTHNILKMSYIIFQLGTVGRIIIS